jgi:hypothetical protein
LSRYAALTAPHENERGKSVPDAPNQSPVQEPEIERARLAVRQQELEIERAHIAVEFAKYGFAGTLTAAAIGSGVIVGLAVLSAFTTFKIDTWGLVAIAVVILIGTIAFGFLSLWELPRIVAKFRDTQFAINPDRCEKEKRADRK